jgi:hypothetical protein
MYNRNNRLTNNQLEPIKDNEMSINEKSVNQTQK